MSDESTATEAAPGETPAEPELLHGCAVTYSRGQRVVHVARDKYLELVRKLVADGFLICSDLCGVDYLTHPGRPLPDGVSPERFEVVLNLLNLSDPQRLRVRVQVPESDPTMPSAFDVWPGTEAMEREAYDMFGLVVQRSPRPDPDPHARRLGRSPAAQGLRPRPHPRAVQRNEVTLVTLIDQTSEHGQEMKARSELTAKELMRNVGAVLRMSEAEAANLTVDDVDPADDQTMIINMGPQHPSTHGVLRLMLELKGETVLRCKPIIGYLHTGMEKTGEDLSFLQGGTNVTRMDYLSPLNNELVFSMATEKLLGIDGDLPERAVWMRMLLSELNRISSHLLFMATNGMDMGAVSMMIYGWREREEVLRFFQKVTGLRMNHNFIRPGGVAADLPEGWRDDVLAILDMLPERLAEYEVLMNDQPIWRERLQGVGVITESRGHGSRGDRPDPAIDWCCVGPARDHCRISDTTRSGST